MQLHHPEPAERSAKSELATDTSHPQRKERPAITAVNIEIEQIAERELDIKQQKRRCALPLGRDLKIESANQPGSRPQQLHKYPARPVGRKQRIEDLARCFTHQASQHGTVTHPPQTVTHPPQKLEPQKDSSHLHRRQVKRIRKKIDRHLPRRSRILGRGLRLKLPGIREWGHKRRRHGVVPGLPLGHNLTQRPRQQRSNLSLGASHHLLAIRPRPHHHNPHRIGAAPRGPTGDAVQQQHSGSVGGEEVQLLPEAVRGQSVMA